MAILGPLEASEARKSVDKNVLEFSKDSLYQISAHLEEITQPLKFSNVHISGAFRSYELKICMLEQLTKLFQMGGLGLELGWGLGWGLLLIGCFWDFQNSKKS